MPQCKNCQHCYYTGKENSPRGLGWCAVMEKKDKRRKGKNGEWYKNINGRWRKTTTKKKISPRGNDPQIAGEINVILEKLVESYSIESDEYGNNYAILYGEGDEEIIINVAAVDNEKTILIRIDLVEIGEEFRSLGLCVPLVTFLLLRAYNNIIGCMEDSTSIDGLVEVNSEYEDRASKCYIKSFENIGFRLDDTKYDTEYGMGLRRSKYHFFLKDKPEDGWKELDGTYKYRVERLNGAVTIDYEINQDGIVAK